MKIALCQTTTVWEDINTNLVNSQKIVEELFEKSFKIDIIVFPEFFTTGFSVDNKSIAEDMNGPSVEWMREMSKKYSAAFFASIPIFQNGKYFNRAFFVSPENEWYYNKRHLFSYGGENRLYSQGDKRVIVNYRGWRILLQICYDLRFPVWSRNVALEYDLIINVANWPSSRESVVSPLVRARAVENLSYYAFVNRAGEDPNCQYNKIGFVSNFKGDKIPPVLVDDKNGIWTIYDLDLDSIRLFRETFRVWEDADKFSLYL